MKKKKIPMKYEYVVLAWDKKGRNLSCVGMKNLDILVQYLGTAFSDKKSPVHSLKALTKKEADKIGIKPTITCMEFEDDKK